MAIELNNNQPVQAGAPEANPANPPVQATQQPTIDVNALTNQLNSVLDNKFNNFQQQMLQQQQAQQAAQPMTQEQKDELNYKLREQFESDPMSFVNNLKAEAEQNAINKLNQQYKPMFEQTQQLNNRLNWQNKVQDFMRANPSAQAYATEMTLILKENPALMQTQNPLGTAYQMATAKDLVGQGGNVIDNMMGNDRYRQQLMGNEQLRQAIIEDYRNQLNGQMSQAQQMPPIMGNNQSGSSIPASGGELPRNLSEAKQAALRRMQMLQGGIR